MELSGARTLPQSSTTSGKLNDKINSNRNMDINSHLFLYFNTMKIPRFLR